MSSYLNIYTPLTLLPTYQSIMLLHRVLPGILRSYQMGQRDAGVLLLRQRV